MKGKWLVVILLLCCLVGCSNGQTVETPKNTQETEKDEAVSTQQIASSEQSSSTEQSASTEKETIIVEVEKEVIKEVVKEVIVEKPVEVIKEVIKEVIVEKPVEKEVIKYQTLYTDDKISMPGKSKGSYLATVKGKYSQVAYLGHEYKVQTSNSKPKWSTSTPDILTVTSDGYVMAKKQGLGVVNDGKHNITIACTNYADGRNPYSWETEIYDNNYWDGGQYSYEAWQDKVNTITDYLRFVYEQGFTYGDVSFQCTSKWVGYGDPRTVLEARKGVCAEAASLACGLLQYDYEDVGTINVSSYGFGHAYSYVYEDGYYYIFDATPLFDRNMSAEDVVIKKCSTIDEIKKYVVDYYNNMVGDAKNSINNTGIAIYMASSKHVGCAPPTYSSFHTGEMYEAFTKGYASNGVEKGFEVNVLWSNPKIKYEFKYVPSRQVKEDGCRTFFLYE